jgi:hypothetical protein
MTLPAPTEAVLIAVTTLPLGHESVKGSPPPPPNADPPGAATAVGVVMYCPTGQPEQADAPAAAVDPKVHGWQEVEADAPRVGEYVPTTQFVQVPEVEAPRSVEYLPATQRVHAVLPLLVANEPTAHSEHIEAKLAPDTAEKDPASQLVHKADPESTEYFPGMHAVQAVELATEN